MALWSLWSKTTESFVGAAVIQLPPFQPNSLKFNTNILIDTSPAFCVSLLGGRCTAVDLHWLLSCLTVGLVVVRNTTSLRWKLVAGPKLEQNTKCKESLLKTVKIALTI